MLYILAQSKARLASLLHLHALPECHMSLDLLGRRFWLWIKPGRASVPFPVDVNVVIARRALPRTLRVRVARLEMFLADRVWRKILVAFHFDRLVALGEHCTFPDCFCHNA